MKTLITLLCAVLFSNVCLAADANIPDPNTQLRALKLARIGMILDDINTAELALQEVIHTPVVTPTKKQIEKNQRDSLFNPSVPQKKKSFYNRKEKQDEINRLKVLIVDYKIRLLRIEANDLDVIVPSFWPPLAVGSIYKTTGGVNTVSQPMLIYEIIDRNNCVVILRMGLGEKYPVEQAVFVRGVSTVNLVDGSLLSPPPFMRITGTTDYFHAAGGKNTLFVLEPFTPPGSF